ncbi:MAG: ECF transporter S component [Clostridia bacterium]|nr:ECF transporter S component [Clostridia bacterium]
MKRSGLLTTKRLCVTAIFMALNMLMSSFSIPVPPDGHFYLNDIIICVFALLFDPLASFLVGGVGAFLGDFFFYPGHVQVMFVSLLAHGLQAAAISLLSRHTFKKKPLYADMLGVSVGAVIMVTGYMLGRAFVYSTPAYALLKLPFELLQAGVGAVAGVLLCRKAGLKKLRDRLF